MRTLAEISKVYRELLYDVSNIPGESHVASTPILGRRIDSHRL